MLVLTRKVQESVVIGGDRPLDQLLKVTVLSIGGQRIKLGFEVPLDIPIHRFELWQSIQNESERLAVPGAEGRLLTAPLREFTSRSVQHHQG